MQGRDGSNSPRGSIGFARAGLIAVFLLLLASLVGVSLASADEAIPGETVPELEEAAHSPAAIEPTPTNPEIAEVLPHHELGREEAAELLEGVFEPEVQGPAGIYADLHVKKFLAPNVAVIAPGRQPEIPDEDEAGGALDEGDDQATLMDSTMPLATEGESGQLEALDLNLERSEGELTPVNPLLEVAIPTELGEGIELSGLGIGIEPVGLAESREASTPSGSIAFYPNVSEETDLAVSPTLGGVETMMQMRSAESPRKETYKLDLPSGASLAKQGAGAVVTRGEETLLTVAPPTALDASGAPVPTELLVDGDDVVIEVSPMSSTDFPTLVDPLFQSFEWYARNNDNELPEGWEGWGGESGMEEEAMGTSYYGEAGRSWFTGASMSAFVPSGSNGMDTAAYGPSGPGEASYWVYQVPRYKSDALDRGGAEPETFITRMTTSDVAWRAQSNALSPYMVMGLWGPSKGWASLYMHEGLTGHSINNLPYVYPFPNESNVPDVKLALVGLFSNETVSLGNDELFVGDSTIELSEPATSAPEFVELSGPAEWLNAGKGYVHFFAKDAGLGVYAISASSKAVAAPAPGSASSPWRTPYICTGVAHSPCPFSLKSLLGIEPEKLPTGIDRLNVTAEDPIGHLSSVGHVEVAVDHTAPEVSLSGSVIEQAILGTKRGSYTVKVQSADGTSTHPQSGVAKVFIEVDGSILKEAEPGCPAENCSVSLEGTIESGKYAVGEHTLKVRAVDTAGNTATVERKFLLTPNPPSLTVSGSMTEQGTLGSSRPRYRLQVNASAEAGIPTTPPAPSFTSSFGSAGTGDGQFKQPGGIARDARGDLWVVDQGNDRVEEFGPGGGYLFQFGTEGTGQGQLKGPTSIAVGPGGDLFVADTGNDRVEKFDPQGHFLSSFGSGGSGNGEFAEPRGIAVDAEGDIWVADPEHQRLEEFSPGGAWLKNLTGTGKEGAGFLGWPFSVAVGPEGDLWIADAAFSEVEVFEPSGAFVRAFGGEGSEPGKFEMPFGIAVDPHGDVWVADLGNDRIEEFDSEGRFLAQFGSRGSGEGQLSLGGASGIAIGPTGTIWVADSGNNRVERWTPTEAGSEIFTEVDLDGRPVDNDSRRCAGEHCPLGDEWTVDSSALSPGKHEVTVTVSDGIGNSTTKTVSVEIERDGIPPALEVGGELANAPEGWVQQETYGLCASATDGGYGVTSLAFKIDGQTVASENAACPEGGCGLSLSSQVDMAPYSGGAHEAEVIATDGAGNRRVKSWTINVDPEGRISTQEEAETLEAVESTTEETPVAPTSELLEPEQREAGDDPGLEVTGSEITSTGVPDVTTMTTNPEEGFSITSPEGTTTIMPVVSGTPSSTAVANGVAGVAANVAEEVDSVIRPEYNGVQIAQAIRSESSPETFSWRVHLAPRQELIQVNPAQAEVVYTDGTESFLITAEPAHDATGKPVPTSLSVSGDELTIKVEFRGGGFVFPVVAGEGWETSYTAPVIVQGPEDEAQIKQREEEEQKMQEELESSGAWPGSETEIEGGGSEQEDEALNAAEPLSPTELSEDLQFRQVGPDQHREKSKPVPLKQAKHIFRKHIVRAVIPAPTIALIGGPGGNGSGGWEKEFHVAAETCSSLDCDIWHMHYSSETDFALVRTGSTSGHQEYATPAGGIHCGGDTNFWWSLNLEVNAESAGLHGKSLVTKGSDEHLTFWCKFKLEILFVPEISDPHVLTENSVLLDRVYPNGYQEVDTKHWNTWINEI